MGPEQIQVSEDIHVADPRESIDPHLQAQELLSAAADGEIDDEVSLRAARRHAANCAVCRAFSHHLQAAGPARQAPTRTWLPEVPSALRIALWTLAACNLTIGLPLALRVGATSLSNADGAHLARDGTLAVALGVVAGIVAWQPRWARPLAPVAIGLLVVQLLGGSTDVAVGRVAWSFELFHILNVVTAGLVIGCAWWSRPIVGRRS